MTFGFTEIHQLLSETSPMLMQDMKNLVQRLREITGDPVTGIKLHMLNDLLIVSVRWADPTGRVHQFTDHLNSTAIEKLTFSVIEQAYFDRLAAAVRNEVEG